MKFLCVLLLVALPGWAADLDDDFEVDKRWAELQTELPPFPKDEDLIAFNTGSVSLGKDGVIRYTMLVQSPSGARNISYEGIHCAAREKKLYALGHADRTWAKPRVSQWERIEYKSINGPHRLLYGDIFCPQRKPVTSTDEALKTLRRGIHPSVEPRR
jgi:hypothetical protein